MPSSETDQQEPSPEPKLKLNASRQFVPWLAEQNISLGFTTYGAGKLFLVGLQENGRLSIFERTFERCMGLVAHGNSLYMSAICQVWKFENIIKPGTAHDGYDAVYVPQVGNTTGDLDIHDMAIDKQGRLIFVNTLFGCLATLSNTHSFVPLWQPKFISKMAAEDRCHLNGLAMENGAPKYVTAVAESDIVDGWRNHRRDGGVVIDVTTNEVVIDGMSMPHSPRIYRNKLWLHDSGNGNFGYADVKTGKFEPVALCRGYLRGLAFAGDFALVGLSLPRGSNTFEELALEKKLAEKNAEPICAIQVIDLRSGDVAHTLEMSGIVEELYDVVALPGIRRPKALGFKSDEIRRVISVGDTDAPTPESTATQDKLNPIMVN